MGSVHASNQISELLECSAYNGMGGAFTLTRLCVAVMYLLGSNNAPTWLTTP